jgi:putative transposase
MAREPRGEAEAGIHHVYARGNGRQAVFLDDVDRRRYLALLGRVVVRSRWWCLAYCLMGNHVHLLVETREPNLGAGMQSLHGRYAQAFNQRHRRDGHLFQGRYGAVRIDTDRQLWAAVRYIARNPVEAGLCADSRDWRWSSYALLRDGVAPDWLDIARLLEYLRAAGGARLADLVDAATESELV